MQWYLKTRGQSEIVKILTTKARVSIFLLLVATLLAFLANAAKILIVNSPQRSDVIVVLAGETDRRPSWALNLLRQGYAARVVMDVPATARIYDTTVLQVAEDYVHKLPEAVQISICPIRGLSTRDESLDVANCLAHQKVSRILLVTSDYHTRRALSIFRREMRGLAFSVAAAPDETQFGPRWWSHRQWAKMCVDEWLRLVWWEAFERWR